MADIISRLRLESGEFDSKIKRAGQELMAYSEHCRKTGIQMGFANKDARDFAQSLGNMQTTSTTARGKINELSDAFVNLRMMYKQMTDEEKNNQFGKNLAASLDQLKTRIQEAKKDLSDVTAELNDKQGGKGGFLSGMGGKMGGAMQVFAGNMMTKAAGVGVDLAMEMADMVKQGVELARQGEGIRIAFERLGRGDILDGLREATHGTVTDLELMKAAVKFNDFKLPLDELGTMLAFAQQKAKDTGQSVDYMVDSIVTGLDRKSLMILDNLGLSASEIKERMKETGDMTKAVAAIIRDQMSKAGDYVETAADRAQQATVAQQNKMEELGRKIMPLAEESAAMWNSIKIGGMSVIANVLDPMISKFTHLGRLMAAQGMSSNGGGGSMGRMIGMLGNGQGDNARSTYNRQVAAFNRSISARRADVSAVERWQRGERSQELQGTMNRLRDMYGADFQRVVRDNLNATINNLNEYKKRAQQLMSSGAAPAPVSDTTPTGTTGGTRSTSSPARQQTEMQQNQTRINELTQQYVTLMAAASEAGKPLTDEQQKQTVEIQRQIGELEKRNGQLKLYQEQAQGKLLGPDAFKQQLSVDVDVNNKKIEELEQQLLSLNGITIDPKTVTITATDEALPKLREIQGITIDEKTVAITADDKTQPEFREVEGIRLKGKKVTVTANTMEALRAVQGINGVTIDPKTVTITATDEALPKLREIQGITIDEKTMTVTANTQEALQAVQGINGVTVDSKTMTVTADTQEALQALQAVNGITIDEKTVAITADDKTQPEFREVEGIRLKGKKITVTANTMEALRAVQGINGVTIDPKTVTITATDEALPKLREIQGITIDDKTMTVTADTQEALQALQAVEGVTIDTKNVKVTAETDEARQKVEELKRQIAELKDQNLMINAGMASLDLQNARDLSRTGGVTGFIGTGKNMMTIEGLPSMGDVVRQRGGNLLDEKAMKAVNEDISKNLPNTKEKDSPLESGKKLLSGISQLTDGLEKIGIDIPDEVQAVIGVIQGVMQVIEAVNTIIGVTQTTALTANTVAMGVLTEALWANTTASIFGFANGGIVPKFADGGLIGRAALGMTIPGNSYSGDNLHLPVDGGRGVIGVNSGEVILNRAQQGVIASALDGGGASQNLKLDAVISGEQIRLVLNNNGRRTGRGEYVQSTRRR